MSEYNVLINKYDALNAGYDQLYPKPMKHANTHASGGTDPITPGDIGAYSKNETDTLLANKAPANIAAYRDIDIRVQDGESIQEALNSIPKNLNGHFVFVDVYGTHTEDITITGFSGYYAFWLRLMENASLNGSVSVYSQVGIHLIGAGAEKSEITNTGSTNGGICVGSFSGSNLICSSMKMTTVGARAISSDNSSRIAMDNCSVKATGSANYRGALEATHQSEIITNAVTIESGTTCGLSALYTSLIRFQGTNNATAKSTTYSGGEVVTLS